MKSNDEIYEGFLKNTTTGKSFQRYIDSVSVGEREFLVHVVKCAIVEGSCEMATFLDQKFNQEIK